MTTITVTTKVISPSIVETTIRDERGHHTWPCPNGGDMLAAARHGVEKYTKLFHSGEDTHWSTTHVQTSDGPLYIMTAR